MGSLLSFLLGEKKKTASVAKERLQIILAHERAGRNAGQPFASAAMPTISAMSGPPCSPFAITTMPCPVAGKTSMSVR